jgi:hypothetical protein
VTPPPDRLPPVATLGLGVSVWLVIGVIVWAALRIGGVL